MTAAAMPRVHPTTRYAQAVVDGGVVAGEMVRLACERHIRDLARQGAEDFPYWFDEGMADAAFDFYEFELHHYEGDLNNHPFILLDWEMFVVGCLYGWIDADGNRKYRTAYILTGKGSGKTPLCAGMGLRGLVDDDEPGAQIYSAATTREQAALGFRDAKAMARKSPQLAAKLHITEHAITYENSYFQTVSSEAGNLHGKRPHIALIDEIHVHGDDSVVEAIRAGTKGRRQAMILMPTNAGQDRRSLAWRYQEYSKRILTGSLTDESWFAYVCQLDVCDAHRAEGKDMPVDGCPACDDWRNEDVWPKANPSLPVVPGYRYLREQVGEAKGMPAKADLVKRLNFCIWTSGRVQWIRPEVWKAQFPRRPERLLRRGYAGYDLSAVNDLTAAAYIFPDGSDAIDIMVNCYLPEMRIDAMQAKLGVPLRQWAEQGYVTLTPGETINYDYIEADDERIRGRYEIVSGGIDPWQSIQFRAHLEDKGIKLVTVPQTNQRLDAVVTEAERLMRVGGFRHGGNPLLEWVAGNVVLNIDGRGMRRLSKEASTEKIDPLAAILNALSEAMVAGPDGGDWVVDV